jgi:hypothetical protein
VNRLHLHEQNQAARVRTVRRVGLDDLAIHDSADYLGAGNAALQEALKRVLVPMDAPP